MMVKEASPLVKAIHGEAWRRPTLSIIGPYLGVTLLEAQANRRAC